MKAFIDKIAGLLPELEARGTVYLFALVEREDIDRWDVVISSDWTNGDWGTAVRTVVNLLRPRLTGEEITLISRIGILPVSDPRVQEMPATLYGVVPEDRHVIYVPFLGSDIRRTFVFRAQRPPVPATTEDEPAALAAQI